MLPQRKNLLRRNAWYRQQLLLNNLGPVTAHPVQARGASHVDRHSEFNSNEATSCAANPSSVERPTAAPAV